MINQKTVFVLGAGASKPYGYPTGLELVDKINQLSSDNKFLDFLEVLSAPEGSIYKEPSQKYYSNFLTELENSGFNSIDKFAANSKHELLCKFAITYSLINQKGPEEPRKDWYKHLYNDFIYHRDINKLLLNNVSFITFNYDTSLDDFLTRIFYTSFPNDWKSLLLEKFKVFHVHGQVRLLPHMDKENPHTYLKLCNDIKFTYQNSEDSYLEEAKNLLKNAQNVYFLGFGFAEENIEKLEINWKNQWRPNSSTRYLGTAFNRQPGQIQKLLRDIKAYTEVEGGHPLIQLENLDCNDFLGHFAGEIK